MQYKVDKKIIEQAVVLAQNIMKHSAIKVRHNDAIAINNFLMKASKGNTRLKLTMQDCEKVVNIAKAYS